MAKFRERLEAALSRIDDPAGEGARACLTVYRDAARAAADAADARAKAGISLGPLDGTIVSIKDLFDVAGEVTRAGSKLLAEEGKPAERDAPVVRRLRAAGAVIVAKTNMTEFAYSGIGANPHFGTPGNPADRKRIPPAGAFPLSYSLDSIGPMARSVKDCADADVVMAGEEPFALEPAPLASLRIGIPQGPPLDLLDDTVAKRFPVALGRLEKAGARLSDETLPLIDAMAEVNAKGGVLPAEALAVHRDRLARRAEAIDPNVRLRLERAQKITAADYVEMAHTRAALIRAMDARLADLDVLAMPTAPVVAPLMSEVATPEDFARKNALVLRNTTMWNFFDCCAISLPLPGSGLPVGLMLVARNGQDRRLFRVAATVERLLSA